jgi:hypothetical protein
LQRPEDGGLADLVFLRQRRHRLAGSVPIGDLALLTDIQRGGATELLALLACLGDACLGARQDQLALIAPGQSHCGCDKFITAM